MSLSPDILAQHWEYNAWATNRVLDAAKLLSPDELTRDFKSADGSVLETFAHLFWSETIWLHRFHRTEPPARPGKGTQDLQTLGQDWPGLHAQWRGQLAEVKDPAAMLTYKDLKGNVWTQPVWILLFHVVNHSTHHRGQISGFLRAMGHPPPSLDFVAYHRSLST
jgi:uncharacterized damage-inducible protein DinB